MPEEGARSPVRCRTLYVGAPGPPRADAGAQLPAILALNATTLGIPCFYGTEQLFDGNGGGEHADRYIREAAFGGDFGPFRSRDRHVFDETSAGYQVLADVLELRRREAALRRGRQ